MNMLVAKRLKLLAIGSLVFFSCEDKDSCNFLYGRWKVYKTIDIDEVAPFPQNDPEAVAKYLASDDYKAILSFAENLANYMIGKEFKFAKSYVGISGLNSKYPIYEITEEQPDIYLYASHHIGDKRNLGINDEVNKIQVIRLRLYKDQQERRVKDLQKVKGNLLQIPFPDCPVTFYIEKLIIYNDEIILSFLILKPGEGIYNPSWQKYLCLRKVK